MNRALKGLRALAAAGTLAALVPGAASLAISLSANAAATQMAATTAVNVRSGPSTGSSKVGILYQGEKVTASSSSNGWTKVTWDGKAAYIASAYLATASAPTTPESSAPGSAAKGDVYTTANVNLRSGPSLTNSVTLVASKGTKLALTGSISGSYSQVVYNGKTLWAATLYLSGTAGAPSTSLPAVQGQARATTALMIRTTATASFVTLGDVPRGTILDLTGTVSGGMAQVIWQGNVRWVNNSYLVKVTGETTPTAPALPSTTTQYATTALNVWSNNTGDAFSGELPRGAQVAVTGTVTNGRAQIVHNGALRWVTAKYLSATPPNTLAPVTPPSTGSDRGDINKGYSSGLDKSNADAQGIAWHIWDNFSEIKTMYGWRRDVTPDHPAGRAVDVMIPNYKTNTDLGWAIAKYFRTNAKAFNVSYIIYQQQIWSVARDKEGWRAMASRGNDTANHYDHVHINTN